MSARLAISNGTRTISLFGGPWFLKNWNPVVQAFKDGGIFIDSPLVDNRFPAFTAYQNATERFDVVLRGEDADHAANSLTDLLNLLAQASTYWTSGGIVDPVYLIAKASKETNTRYAAIVSGSFSELGNPFSSPFLQGNCPAVMDNLSLIIERQEWISTPPWEGSMIYVTESVKPFNYIQDGSFEGKTHHPLTTYGGPWTSYGSPTTCEKTSVRAYSGQYSVKIAGSSGADRGMYQEFDELTNGTDVTVTARCFVQTGIGELIVEDGGGGNAVTDSAGGREEQRLSNTGFESSLTGWGVKANGSPVSSLTATRSSAQAYAGSWSAKLDYQYDASTPYQYLGVAYRDDTFEYFRTDAIAISDYATGVDAKLAYYINNFDTAGFMWYINVCFYKDNRKIGTVPIYSPVGTYVTGAWQLARRRNIPVPATATHMRLEVAFPPPFILTGYTQPFDLTIYVDSASLKETAIDIDEHGEWQLLSVTKTVPVGDSIRVSVGMDGSATSEVYFDSIELNIDYKDDVDEEYGYVSNVSLPYNLSHIFRKINGGAWSDNVLFSDLPSRIMPSTGASDDAIYFGSIAGPFCSLAFDVVSIVDATSFAVTWEYYSNGSWYSLDVEDGTDSFQNGGRNVVVWNMPSDIEPTTTNSVYGWWVRARISSVSGLVQVPYQGNSHIYTVSQPYFDVSSDNVGGSLPALGKYRVISERGPVKNTVNITISANADDCDVIHGTTTLSTSNTTARLQEDRDIGLRFQNVTIPQGAKIISAKLICTPGDNASGNWSAARSYVRLNIHGHDANTSSAWSTYADYNSRTRTTAAVSWVVYPQAWGIGLASASIESINISVAPDVGPVIQEIVDRTNWASGNNMSLFISGADSSNTADYAVVYMEDTVGGPTKMWALDVEYVTAPEYTTAYYMGLRSLSRGENFTAYINANSYNKDGIVYEPGSMALEVDGVYYDVTYPLIDYGHLVPNGTGTQVRTETTEWQDRVIFRIMHPLASEYPGRYRLFARARTRELASSAPTLIRLRCAVGIGGSSFTNFVTFNNLVEAELIDLGPITIPKVSQADAIVLAIQTKILGLTGSEYTNFDLFDIILLPIDEWSVEAVALTDNVLGYLDGDSMMEVDSINSRPRPIMGTVRDKKTDRARAFLATAGSPVTLSPSNDQRIWCVSTSYIPEREISVTDAQRTEASLSQAVHSVHVTGLSRYLGMRGDR